MWILIAMKTKPTGNNTNQRRLYYAQEFRPFIQDGSFIMEKPVASHGIWDFLMEKV